MPRQTPEEIRAAFQGFVDNYARERSTLVDRMEAEMRSCLDSKVATPSQKKEARRVLIDCSAIRRMGDSERESIPTAIYAGMAFERCRSTVLEGPAKSGRMQGTHWRDSWIELPGLLIKIANFLMDRIGPDGMDIHDVVRECWGERYHAENRSKYDKAFSQLGTRLLNADPPIRVTIAVRGDRVFVEASLSDKQSISYQAR